MKKITMTDALKETSPHPVSLISSLRPDGSTNLAAVSWWTYLESEPSYIGFTMWDKSYTCELVFKSGKAVLSIPGEAIADITLKCGTVSGRDVDKVKEFGIEMAETSESCGLKFPVHSRLAFECTVENKVEVGECYFFICKVGDIYFDENEKQIFAWGGSSTLAPMP